MKNLIQFNKHFESSADLSILLQKRGLIITDLQKIESYLDNIGYYRLSAYMYPFMVEPKSKHEFKKGISFDQVINLYRFDKKLRMLIFNEIEKIEISLRRAIMQIPAELTNDPFWLTNVSNFVNTNIFNETLITLKKENNRSREEFINHFKNTYSNPLPPSWILGELLTIGNLNSIYRNIKYNNIRKRISRHFGLPIDVFESWLTNIAITRNACGHHSRVWNKQNAITPAKLKNPIYKWIINESDTSRIYYNLCIINYFLHTVSPDNNLTEKIISLLDEFPDIDSNAMGFPRAWESEPLWQLEE